MEEEKGGGEVKYTFIELILTIVIVSFVIAIIAGFGIMIAVWIRWGWLLLTTDAILK